MTTSKNDCVADYVACLCSLNRLRSLRLVSPMYCFLLQLHSVIYVSLVVLFLLCWLKVSYVLPWLMYGQESAGGGGGGGKLH